MCELRKVENFYRAECETKLGGSQYWAIDLTAATAKDARKKFDELWRKAAHPFRIKIRKLKPTEEFLYHYFTKIK